MEADCRGHVGGKQKSAAALVGRLAALTLSIASLTRNRPAPPPKDAHRARSLLTLIPNQAPVSTSCDAYHAFIWTKARPLYLAPTMRRLRSNYLTTRDWAAALPLRLTQCFSSAANLNFGIGSGSWSCVGQQAP